MVLQILLALRYLLITANVIFCPHYKMTMVWIVSWFLLSTIPTEIKLVELIGKSNLVVHRTLLQNKIAVSHWYPLPHTDCRMIWTGKWNYIRSICWELRFCGCLTWYLFIVNVPRLFPIELYTSNTQLVISNQECNEMQYTILTMHAPNLVGRYPRKVCYIYFLFFC